jgi:hypothetical protein
MNVIAGDGFSVLLIPHTLRVTAWGESMPATISTSMYIPWTH